ncbi:MAG: TetR/AcrR family transcriptional regulator [Anaerolineae bacterium]
MSETQRVEQIYAAAARLFSRYGYHGTTIRQMARELDLQGGSLYAHISAKEDVLWGIVDHAANQFLAAVDPIAACDLAPAEKLRAALRAHIGVVTDNLDAATVYFQDWKFLGDARRDAIRAKRDTYEGYFRQIIAEGIEAGAFRQVDEKFAALLVLSVGNWLYQWYRPNGPLPPTAVADEFIAMILAGVSAEPDAVNPTYWRPTEVGASVP